MRLAIDFDGVIADTSTLKQAYVKERLGQEVSIAETDKATLPTIIGEESYKEMIRAIYSSKPLEAPVVEGAKKCLKELAKHHTLIIVTNRSDEEIHVMTSYLQKHGLQHDKVVNTPGQSKEEICLAEGVDAILEDSLAQLARFKRGRTRLYLLTRPYNKGMHPPPNIERTESWRDFTRRVTSPKDR